MFVTQLLELQGLTYIKQGKNFPNLTVLTLTSGDIQPASRERLVQGLKNLKLELGSFLVNQALIETCPTLNDLKMTFTDTCDLESAHAKISISEEVSPYGPYLFRELERENSEIGYGELLVTL